MADLLVAAGASRVLAMTPHSPQVHGFSSVPVDHLHALRELAAHFGRYDLSRTTVVSPDLGNAKEAAAFARLIGAQVAAGARQRHADDRVSVSSVIGDVAGRDVIVLDDETAKGSTVLELLDRLRESGPRSIRVACTHGLFAAGARERLTGQPDVLEVVCTNTVPMPAAGRAGEGNGDSGEGSGNAGEGKGNAGGNGRGCGKLRVLSIAPALDEAVRRIRNGESVSALFDAPRGERRPERVTGSRSGPSAAPGQPPASAAEAAAGPGR